MSFFPSPQIRSRIPLVAPAAMLVVVCCSGAASELRNEAVQKSLRLLTGPYTLNGKLIPVAFDATQLQSIRNTGNELARELSELRLSIHELQSSLSAAENKSREVIRETLTEAVPLVCSQFLLNAATQVADGDDSLERTLKESLSAVDSITQIRREAVSSQQILALTQYAVLAAEDELRQTLISAMDSDGISNRKEPELTTNWVADAKSGLMQMKITNSTGHPLKNALIVADVDVNQELLNSTETGTMVIAGGLASLIGIDPEEEQSLVVINRKCDTINRGGTAFVDEWPAGQTLEFPVCGISVFLSRAQSATLSIASETLTVVDKPVSIHTAVEMAEKKIAEFQAQLSEKAKREIRKREREHSREKRRQSR